MQNKPNLRDTQMNVTAVNTMNNELRTMSYFVQNKPNQTQFQRQKNAAAFGNQLAEIICSAGSVSFFAAIVAAIRVSAVGFRFQDDSVSCSLDFLLLVEIV